MAPLLATAFKVLHCDLFALGYDMTQQSKTPQPPSISHPRGSQRPTTWEVNSSLLVNRGRWTLAAFHRPTTDLHTEDLQLSGVRSAVRDQSWNPQPPPRLCPASPRVKAVLTAERRYEEETGCTTKAGERENAKCVGKLALSFTTGKLVWGKKTGTAQNAERGGPEDSHSNVITFRMRRAKEYTTLIRLQMHFGQLGWHCVRGGSRKLLTRGVQSGGKRQRRRWREKGRRMKRRRKPDVISHSAAEYQSVPGKPLSQPINPHVYRQTKMDGNRGGENACRRGD
ncbi:unnamed protein product [Pleuronectes platessa]|uniref:Uncharacterized protein n=1 Tax=Pleuronectes platessa TaxID=8262 RepID=A0A9N7V1L4_PLEPL|nr:unnamed protein product [Pleuronectes platessa]